jgi:hypothetical protein
LPINPVVGRAIVSNLRKHYNEDPDVNVILNTNATRVEKTKAFERIIFHKILLSPSECVHTKLDGSDKQTSEFIAEYSQIIPNSILIPQAPTSHALFVCPTVRNLSDCRLYSCRSLTEEN